MTHARPRIVLAATAAACLLAAAGPAHAYVRYRTEAGQPFAWPSSCLGIIAYPAQIADMVPQDQAIAAATAAADAWSAGAVEGTALDIQVAATGDPPPVASYDGQSSLLFRSDRWCRATDAPGICSYDPGALALTSVFARNATGEILDADIEINATLFMWSDLELGTQASAGLHDLQNALTHEMGHFIGLDHPCVLAGTLLGADRPLDNLGNPAPDCDVASEAILESTMFPSALPGDLSKRTLGADDELAARELYPAGAGAPAFCPPPEPKRPDPGGCAVGGAPVRAPGALATLVAALAWGAARRMRSARLAQRR